MRHNLNVPEEREQMLRESLIDWIRGSDYSDIKEDATGMVQLMGAHEFVYQLLLEYLAHHGQPFTHQLEWPNFTLQLSMSIWFSEDKASHDLYVLPSDDRFDFTAPDLATNGWLQSRGEDLSGESFNACSERQRPDQLRFVSSQSRPGTTYCFVPLLHSSQKGTYDITLRDSWTGLHRVLDSVVWKSRSSVTAYRSVLIIPFGFELLTAQMDELVWHIWHELKSAGHGRSMDSRELSERLTIRLAFGSPQVLVSLLKVMLDEDEDFHDSIFPQTSAMADECHVPVPEYISKPWKDSYLAEYRKAYLNPERWARLTVEVPRIAEDLCTRLQHRGGLKRMTLRELMLNEVPDDRFVRMLVARRVILRYFDLVQSRGEGYSQLIRELGFVKYGEADEALDNSKDTTNPNLGRSAIQNDNFKNYLSDLGLKKPFVLSPLDTGGLFQEELEWKKRLYEPS